MLQPVALAAKSLADYTHIVGRPLVEEIRRLVLALDGVDYALARATAYAQAAKADLEVFSPSEEREVLGLIADFVVDRDR